MFGGKWKRKLTHCGTFGIYNLGLILPYKWNAVMDSSTVERLGIIKWDTLYPTSGTPLRQQI